MQFLIFSAFVRKASSSKLTILLYMVETVYFD